MPYGNSGDGIRLGESVGGLFNSNMKSPIALTPINTLRSGEGRLETMPIFFNRGVPGVIAVTRDGKRFVNEGRSYHDFGVNLLKKTPPDSQAVAWIICDRRVVRRYGLGRAFHSHSRTAGSPIESGYLKCGRDVRELAESAGSMRPAWSRASPGADGDAASRRDSEFHVWHQPLRAWRMVTSCQHEPIPALARWTSPPLYAHSRVCRLRGDFRRAPSQRACPGSRPATSSPLQGLYAVGNDMSSITGGDSSPGAALWGPA